MSSECQASAMSSAQHGSRETLFEVQKCQAAKKKENHFLTYSVDKEKHKT